MAEKTKAVPPLIQRNTAVNSVKTDKDILELDKDNAKKFKIRGNIVPIIEKNGTMSLDLSSYALGSMDELMIMIRYGKQYFMLAFLLASFLTVINVFGFMRLYDLLGTFEGNSYAKVSASVLLSCTLEYMILYSGLTGMKEMFENSKRASKLMGFVAFIPFAIGKATTAIENSGDLFSKNFLDPLILGIAVTGIGIIFSARIPDYISEAVSKIREIYFYKSLK